MTSNYLRDDRAYLFTRLLAAVVVLFLAMAVASLYLCIIPEKQAK